MTQGENKQDPPPLADLDVLSSFAAPKQVQLVTKPSFVQSNKLPSAPSSGPVYVVIPDETDDIADNHNNRMKFTTLDDQKASEMRKAKYVPISNVTKSVGYLSSLKLQLSLVSALLLAGLIVTMILTALNLHDEGSTWMNTAGNEIQAKQLLNIQAFTDADAVYVKNYFTQLSLDLKVAANYFTLTMDGELARSNYTHHPNYHLPSYSLDTYNPYSKPSVSNSYNFSGYFVETATNCQNTPNRCKSTQFSNTTALTSILDIKFRSLHYANNALSFLQIGLQHDGYTRYLPYAAAPNYCHPTTCTYNALEDSICAQKYATFASYLTYPSYDARCRSWFQFGVQSNNPLFAYFQDPRVSSSGDYVVTAVTPIKSGTSSSGSLYGVLNSNFKVSVLSNAFNQQKILDTGYVYVVDLTNSSIFVVHPKASKGCIYVYCAEQFQGDEYDRFQASVINPIQAHASSSEVATQYTKQGDTWVVKYAYVNYETIEYALIATVPLSEVLEASNETQTRINYNVNVMIAVFVIAIILFIVCVILITRGLIKEIIDPVNELRVICQLIRDEDLTSTIPTASSSLDMKVLLDAFSKLMIALRFASDSYSRGDNHAAREVFSQALELFTSTENLRGIGASLNNLAAVELASGNIREAEALYKKAIENAEQLIEGVAGHEKKMESDVKKLKRILSDRKGNLTVVYLEENNFAAAFQILEKLLEEDKSSGYIRGCVVKQGILGQYYLKQGEVKSAERVFQSALTFIRQKDEALYSEVWNHEETDAAEQIALYHLALLQEHRTDSETRIQSAYVEALSHTSLMHTSTATKILIALDLSLHRNGQTAEAAEVGELARTFNFHMNEQRTGKKTSSGALKRVVFAIDYSGSMSGTKIRSAMDNVQSIIKDHVHDQDDVCIIRFNHLVEVVHPLNKKRGDGENIANNINQLLQPTGSTRLYNAVQKSLQALSTSSMDNDWAIILTDGEDNGSQHTLDAACEHVKKTKVGLIIIGVGSDVQTSILERIAKSSKKGLYIFAPGDKSSIDQAFGQVAMVIQGQVLLEEY